MADTNLSQWNPTAASQETDANYQSDSQRTGGAADGQFWDAATANKFLYQNSTFIRALAVMLVNKGYSPKDGTSPYQADTSSNAAVTALASVLGNILTEADLQTVNLLVTASGTGYIKFGVALGGLILQWNTAVSFTLGTPLAVTFNTPFNNSLLHRVMLTPYTSGVTSCWVTGDSATGFTLNSTGSGTASVAWLAIGF